MDQDLQTDATPRNHPTYGVQLDDATITEIVRLSLPASTETIIVSRLPTGQSFNNRIYLIDVKEGSEQQSYVLKVNGRFFGGQKIENEVSCLLVLGEFCKDVPVPKVIAWSINGTTISKRASNRSTSTSEFDMRNMVTLEGKDIPGWILMTRLPGSNLDPSALTSDETSHVVKQIADILLSWRRNIPRSRHGGDLRFQSPSKTDDTTYYPSSSHLGLALYNYGVVGSGNSSTTPISSVQSFWDSEIRSQMKRMREMEIFAPNREALLPLLEQFLTEILTKLSICQRNQTEEEAFAGDFTFTHTDFAPRNILVSDSHPPEVTGVVDFEFAGFLPQFEEFVAMYIGCKVEEDIEEEGSDWPPKMYGKILEESEKEGEKTVLSLKGTREWVELRCLETIRMETAHFWLAQMDDAGSKDEGVGEMLAAGRKAVLEKVEELRRLVEVGERCN